MIRLIDDLSPNSVMFSVIGADPVSSLAMRFATSVFPTPLLPVNRKVRGFIRGNMFKLLRLMPSIIDNCFSRKSGESGRVVSIPKA